MATSVLWSRHPNVHPWQKGTQETTKLPKEALNCYVATHLDGLGEGDVASRARFSSGHSFPMQAAVALLGSPPGCHRASYVITAEETSLRGSKGAEVKLKSVGIVFMMANCGWQLDEIRQPPSGTAWFEDGETLYILQPDTRRMLEWLCICAAN